MRLFTIIVAMSVSVGGCAKNASLPTSPTTQTNPAVQPQPPAPSGPPGTIVGIVKDGQGNPIPDVVVSGATVLSTTTDGSGRFTLPAPVCPDRPYASTALRFDKAGYLDLYPWYAPCPFSGTLSVTVQPVISMTSDSRVAATVFTGDTGYYVGDFCAPCKVITVHVDSPATVNVRVHWSGATPLGLWTLGASGGMPQRPDPSVSDISVDMNMTPSIDTQLVVGVIEDTPFPIDVPFEVTTPTVAAQ
jgi:hypothetical protein